VETGSGNSTGQIFEYFFGGAGILVVDVFKFEQHVKTYIRIERFSQPNLDRSELKIEDLWYRSALSFLFNWILFTRIMAYEIECWILFTHL
jgi:hypothetical protein